MDDISNLRDTATPKSDQLNADDLINTTKIIRITGVKRGTSKDQPISIEYDNMQGRPFKPCKSMRRLLIAAYGEDGREWVGKSIKLYTDPNVIFGGVKVGGIRISHLSDIDKTMSIMLSVSKGRREPVTVSKLPTYPQTDFDQKATVWIEAIKAGKITLDQVIEKASATGVLTAAQIEFLKGAIKDGN